MNLENQLYMYKAHVDNVVDGDTVDITLDHGFNVYSKQRVRLLSVDTPERGQENYHQATEFTTSKLLNQNVVVQTYKSDNFGRYLATIFYLENGEYKSISQELTNKGFIKPNSKWNTLEQE